MPPRNPRPPLFDTRPLPPCCSASHRGHSQSSGPRRKVLWHPPARPLSGTDGSSLPNPGGRPCRIHSTMPDCTGHRAGPVPRRHGTTAPHPPSSAPPPGRSRTETPGSTGVLVVLLGRLPVPIRGSRRIQRDTPAPLTAKAHTQLSPRIVLLRSAEIQPGRLRVVLLHALAMLIAPSQVAHGPAAPGSALRRYHSAAFSPALLPRPDPPHRASQVAHSIAVPSVRRAAVPVGRPEHSPVRSPALSQHHPRSYWAVESPF